MKQLFKMEKSLKSTSSDDISSSENELVNKTDEKGNEVEENGAIDVMSLLDRQLLARIKKDFLR